MDCNIIKDLLPLYADDCCSEESRCAVEEHIGECSDCRQLLEQIKTPEAELCCRAQAPALYSKINQRKAAVLQSVLLYVSFALITVGVAIEAGSEYGLFNGLAAWNLVVPACGFMLSLANWYFVHLYRDRKSFSRSCLFAFLLLSFAGAMFTGLHYAESLREFVEVFIMGIFLVPQFLLINYVGTLLTVLFAVLSLLLSRRYAMLLGKE